MAKAEQTFVLRESGEWLRYALWSAAVGMAFLTAGAVGSPIREVGKIVGGVAGVLLFGFGGFAMQSRRVVVDPSRREVTISDKGFRGSAVERLAFDDVRKILILKTSEVVDNLQGTSVMRDRWGIALVLEDRSVQLTRKPYLTRDQALHDAWHMQRRIGVEISDDVAEGIAHLARSGRKVDAITQATRALGMTPAEAKDFVDSLVSRSNRS